MRKRCAAAFVVALLLIGSARPVHADYSNVCDEECSRSWRHSLWLLITNYGSSSWWW